MLNLEIKKFGCINYANIEICGLTILAGANSSGKSTIGRALYSTFNMLADKKKLVNSYRAEYLDITFRDILGRYYNYLDVIDELKRLFFCNKILQPEELYDRIISNFPDLETENDEALEEILCKKIKIIFSDEVDIVRDMVIRDLYNEFGALSSFIHEEETEVTLNINKTVNSIRHKDGSINFNIQPELNLSAIYVGNDISTRNEDLLKHTKDLTKLIEGNPPENVLFIRENKETLGKVYELIETFCRGDIFIDPETREIKFIDKSGAKEKIYSFSDVSMGLKIFAILKKLLKNLDIKYKSTIILDEPEANLHPENQILLAEILVILQKKLSLHLLISTHNSLFLKAIEVYTKQYSTEENTKYYTVIYKGDGMFNYVCEDDTDEIYNNLISPNVSMYDLEGELNLKGIFKTDE